MEWTGRPISAPIAGDLVRTPSAVGCARPDVRDEWTYTWDGDRLTAAVRVHNQLPTVRHALTYDDAGRLLSWSHGPDGFRSEVELRRDDAGALTGWTRTSFGQPMIVSISRAPDEVELRMRGALFGEHLTPLLIDIDRIDPGLAEHTPRIDLIRGYVDRVAVADGDEAATALLEDFNANQRVRASDDGQETSVDVDGDGAPDVIERVTHGAAGTTTTIDFAVDAKVEVTIDAQRGRVERMEIDPEGAVIRTVTQAEFGHVFIDQLAEDGSINERSSLFFDARGARLLKYEDRNADGRPNWRKRYINDPVSGFRLFDETDSGADGSIDLRREYDRDAEGRVLRATQFDVHPDDCGARW